MIWSFGHSAHHSSEEYNLSTALRQGSLEKFSSMFLYLPLALFCDSDVMKFYTDINISYQVSGKKKRDTSELLFLVICQFWVHTEEIRRMPSLVEWLFVTPSHHRVHHARNPRMIDKNYSGKLFFVIRCGFLTSNAGMFIIWDRLFGTFQPEDEKCVYGLVHPIQTFNPLRVQFELIINCL